MCCPRCEVWKDILAFLTLQQAPKFIEETVPIYKCPECKFLFALSDRV